MRRVEAGCLAASGCTWCEVTGVSVAGDFVLQLWAAAWSRHWVDTEMEVWAVVVQEWGAEI